MVKVYYFFYLILPGDGLPVFSMSNKINVHKGEPYDSSPYMSYPLPGNERHILYIDPQSPGKHLEDPLRLLRAFQLSVSY